MEPNHGTMHALPELAEIGPDSVPLNSSARFPRQPSATGGDKWISGKRWKKFRGMSVG